MVFFSPQNHSYKIASQRAMNIIQGNRCEIMQKIAQETSQEKNIIDRKQIPTKMKTTLKYQGKIKTSVFKMNQIARKTNNRGIDFQLILRLSTRLEKQAPASKHIFLLTER